MSDPISAKDVKTLRDRTGAGMMDCKAALQEAGGDVEKAIEILRVKGQASAAKRGERAASEGVVTSYIHAGARSACWWRSTARPTSWPARKSSRTSPARWRCTWRRRGTCSTCPRTTSTRPGRRPSCGSTASRRPPRASPRTSRRRSCEGRMGKRLDEVVLLNQTHVNEDKHERQDARGDASQLAAGTGENVVMRRFARFVVGEEWREPAFRRILLKLSGEALMGDLDYGADPERIAAIAGQVQRGSRRPRRRDRDRGGRRQHLPRALGRRGRHGPRHRRLHGHACHGAERAGAPGRAREDRRRHARAVGDHDLRGGRALHPAARHAPPREGPDRDLRRRAPATRSSPPTPRPPCARSRSTPRRS